MTLRLHQKDIPEMVLERTYPLNYVTDDHTVKECVTELNYPIGKASYQEIYFDGVHIGYGNAILSDKVLLGFETDVESVEMHFALLGKTTAITDQFGREISFQSNQHNIIYANSICGNMLWEPNTFKLCEINLAPSFFKKYLPEGQEIFENFRKAIDQGKSALISRQHRSISYQMYQLIEEITTCERKGIFKRMFLEAKVLELLMLQLEQLSEEFPTNTSLKKADVEKIYAVKELLSSTIDENYSLIELAHKVGTNEFTLKKGFKELFGTTVFGFWHDVKMNQAKSMLLDADKSIYEVAELIGYKNPRHFSSAFKRKFGILPSKVKIRN